MTKDVRDAIMLFFDDSHLSTYTEAFQYMQQYPEMVASCHIVSGLVGQSNKLTVVQMEEMYAAGWKMCNHTANHIDESTLTRTQNATELATCRDALRSWGFADGALHCAYTGGGTYTADADGALIDIQARTHGPASNNNGGRSAMDVFFPAYGQNILLPIAAVVNSDFHPLSLRTEAQAETATVLWMSTTNVNKLVGYIIFHDIVVSGATGVDNNRADFRKYIDFLHTQNYRFTTLPDFWALHAPRDKHCIP